MPKPTLSLAVAERTTDEPTVMPAAGAVNATVGAVLSGQVVIVPARAAAAESRIRTSDDFGVSSA